VYAVCISGNKYVTLYKVNLLDVGKYSPEKCGMMCVEDRLLESLLTFSTNKNNVV